MNLTRLCKVLDRITDAFLLLIILVLLEVITRLKMIPAFIFPSPSIVFMQFYSDIAAGVIPTAVIHSLYRCFMSLMIGVTSGVFVGWIMGWYRLVERIMAPLFFMVYPIPMLAFYSIFIVWFGFTDQSIIAVGAITAFFQMLLNTITGLKKVDPLLIMAAKDYGVKGRQMITKVVFPSALPVIMAGFKLAVVGAFIVDVTAEMIVTPPGMSGLGWLVAYYAFIQNYPAGTMSSLLALAIVGCIIFLIVDTAEKKASKWRRQIT